MRKLILFLPLWIPLFLHAQELVRFPASDGVTVFADLYYLNDTAGFVLLFHQEGSSRGEFRETAPRINKLGYNCLAVDLRSGKEMNYIRNETFNQLPDSLMARRQTGAEEDMKAAIRYVEEKYHVPVLLLGSSASATLAIKIAGSDSTVQAVIAFSPGEYFLPAYSLEQDIRDFSKPIFVTGSKREYPYLEKMFSGMPPGQYTLFQPHNGAGMHGSRSLWSNNPNRDEYWLSLLLFFRGLKN